MFILSPLFYLLEFIRQLKLLSNILLLLLLNLQHLKLLAVSVINLSILLHLNIFYEIENALIKNILSIAPGFSQGSVSI